MQSEDQYFMTLPNSREACTCRPQSALLIRWNRSALPPLRAPRAESACAAAFNKLEHSGAVFTGAAPTGQPHGVSLSALRVNRRFCVQQGKQSCPNGDPVGSRYAFPARANGRHGCQHERVIQRSGGGLSWAPGEGRERQGSLWPCSVQPLVGWPVSPAG